MASAKNRITADMSAQEIVLTMSEGNPSALTCMMELLFVDCKTGLLDIQLFDSMGIYGSKIYMVWSDCCGRDMEKFKATIQAFREGKFTEQEIHENLSRPYARPFI